MKAIMKRKHMEQYLFWCELKEQPYSEIDRKLSTKLSKDRQDKINRYRFDADKRLSLYSGLLVRMGIQKLCNIPYEEQTFVCENMKKSSLINDQSIQFNLSHTRNMIVCGYSEQPVGVDVERIKVPFHKEILKDYNANEQLQCQRGSELEQAIAFYQIWTKKEAYVKCDGNGLAVELAEIPTNLPQFKTWNKGEYIISLFSRTEDPVKLVKITEDEIAIFFDFGRSKQGNGSRE